VRKIVLVLLIIVVSTGVAFAQDFDPMSFPPSVNPGDFMIDFGVGLMRREEATILIRPKWKIPPLFVQAEYALPAGAPISIGGLFTFCQYSYDLIIANVTATNITFAARTNWHFGLDIDNLDIYLGGGLGYTHTSSTGDLLGTGISGSKGKFFWNLQLGLHYYFTENIGAMVEVGYPHWIKGGIALKFGTGQPTQQKAQTTQATQNRFMLVNADSLNVRSGPSADNASVGQVTRNARVEVLDSSGQWWRIRHGNVEGYVNSSFLVAE